MADCEVDKRPWYGLLEAMVNQARTDLILQERELNGDSHYPTRREKEEAREFLQMMENTFAVWLNEKKYAPRSEDIPSKCSIWFTGYCRKNCSDCFSQAGYYANKA